MKYKIGTPANVQRCLASLLEKELLLATPRSEGTTYSVCYVFLASWLERR